MVGCEQIPLVVCTGGEVEGFDSIRCENEMVGLIS